MSFIARSLVRSLANNTHTNSRVKTNSRTPSGRRLDTDKETHVHPNVLDFNPPFICMRSVCCVPTLSLSLVISCFHTRSAFIWIQLSIRGRSYLLLRKAMRGICVAWEREVFCLSSRIFISTWRWKGCFLSVLFPFSSLFSNNSELAFCMNV